MTSSLAAGCGGEALQAPDPEAGGATVATVDAVAFVDNREPAWSSDRVWTIGEEPLLTLGVDSGEPAEMFTDVDAVLLSNGALVVADRGSRELRYFDAAGRYVGSAGRRGEGPGEFQQLSFVHRAPGDAVLATEYPGRPVARYGPDRELEASFQLADHGHPAYGIAFAEDVFPDGSILARGTLQRNADGTWPSIEGERGFVSSGWFRYGADGSEPLFLVELPAYESNRGGGEPTPFQALGFTVPHGEGIYHVEGRGAEILDYDLEGRLRRRIRQPLEPLPVTTLDRERWLEKSRDNYEAAGRELTPERIATIVWPEAMPTRRGLVVDAAGHIWVERHLGMQHSRPLRWGNAADPFFPETDSAWDVFDTEGTWLGTVELLPGRTVHQIDDRRVLLSGEDEAGVVRIWLYELIKP